MMAARSIVFGAAVLLALAAFGARELQPSAFRLAVGAVSALLAPLFWPGIATTLARTALRVGAWSVAPACVAAAVLRFGGRGQTLIGILPVCGMLLLILLVGNAAAAELERRWRMRGSVEAGERARRTVTLVLALAGASPLWLGPAAEILTTRAPWIVDAVVGVSPLTHLAVASGNDLLRNPWFYQHANLAALRFSYPSAAAIIVSYAAVAAILALVALASRYPQRPPLEQQPSIYRTKEQAR